MTQPVLHGFTLNFDHQTPALRACWSPVAGRHDDIAHRLRHGQSVLASRHRSGDSVSLVLVRPCRHAIQTEGCQSLPSPGRAGSGASLAVPASPRGSGKDLDDLDTAPGECVEEGKPLDDPGVVGARVHTAHIGRPADAADRLSELELAFASSLSCRRAGTRAIDGGDPRRIRYDKVNDLLARQAALEGQDPAIIDDRNVETLPLSAHINADPQSHESKHAPSHTPALRADAENVAGPSSHKHGRRYTAERSGGKAPAPVAVSAKHGPTRLQAGRPGKKRRKRSVGGMRVCSWQCSFRNPREPAGLMSGSGF